MSLDIFISYSSKNKAIADAACHALENANIRCWMAPRDIKSGDVWPAAITNAITTCRLMLLIYTKDSNESTEVHREVALAGSHNKIILPFAVDNIKKVPMHDAIKYYLTSAHWLEAYPDWREKFSDLVNDVHIALNKPPVQPPKAPRSHQPGGSRVPRFILISVSLVIFFIVAAFIQSCIKNSEKKELISGSAPAPVAADKENQPKAAASLKSENSGTLNPLFCGTWSYYFNNKPNVRVIWKIHENGTHEFTTSDGSQGKGTWTFINDTVYFDEEHWNQHQRVHNTYRCKIVSVDKKSLHMQKLDSNNPPWYLTRYGQ